MDTSEVLNRAADLIEEQLAEMDARPGECGVQYEQHPTLPDLVAICARPEGHDGEHSNVLPKTLASLLGRSTLPGATP